MTTMKHMQLSVDPTFLDMETSTDWDDAAHNKIVNCVPFLALSKPIFGMPGGKIWVVIPTPGCCLFFEAHEKSITYIDGSFKSNLGWFKAHADFVRLMGATEFLGFSGK